MWVLRLGRLPCTHSVDALPRATVRSFAASSSQQTGDEQVAFISGASGGLGLEFARQLLQRPGQRVIAGCRRPDQAQELQQLKEQHAGTLTLIPLDLTDEQSIQAAAKGVGESYGHVDLVLNAAGILHIPGVMSPETSLSRVTPENLLRNFQINAFGPILVSKAFWPLLAKAKSSEDRPAKLVSLSARVGSIADNSIGGWYSYRASKTALNQLTKCMSVEIARRKQHIATLLLHPGTVDTGLSEPFQKNVKPEKLFSRERAVKQLLEIIDRATSRDQAKFVAWDGEQVPW